MGYRKQPFGYKMELGEVVIYQDEAELVTRIFERYMSGASFSGLVNELREQPVSYDKGKLWNKNMVARILEDRRYLGEQDYPVLIDREVFETVKELREKKPYPQQGTETQKTLRRLSGGVAPKWMETQTLALLNTLIATPEMIKVPLQPAVNPAVYEMQNRLNELLEQRPLDEAAAKALTLELAVKQYESIGNSEYETERLKRAFSSARTMDELDAELLKSTVSSIHVTGREKITIQLKNGQRIGSDLQ